ncbi:hypothetical protein JOE09_000501 [Pantoea coffeiphila]|nr:hypothetical protein [Pantoea coffeiphila]
MQFEVKNLHQNGAIYNYLISLKLFFGVKLMAAQ